MTVTDRTDATDQEFAARIAAFDAAPYPQEVRRAAAQQHIAQQYAKAEAMFGRDVVGTAVDLDALDAARDELAELIWGVLVAAGMRDGTRAPSPSVIAHAIVGNLLPVVDRIASERAATELEAAAEEGWGPEDQDYVYTEVSDWLRDRAAALRAATGETT